jgi:predicted O-methyltransferase YrrM
VRASQRRPEIRELARRVAELEPRNVLEIGTFLGGTLLLWSQLATRRVISCDLRIPRVRRALYRRFPRPGSGCEVVLLEGDSHSPAFRGRVVDALEGEPVDFLFVDGDHSESGVEADYRDYAPLVRPGGLIAFHDIVERQPTPETAVHAFWRRLRASVAATELVEDPAQVGFGIGVVQVGAREAPAASER